MWDHCSCQQCLKHEWGAEPLTRVWAEVCFLFQCCRFEFCVIFCINCLCTEKQTWMFASSWSECDFDVTSKDLLNLCLVVLAVQRSCSGVDAGRLAFMPGSLLLISPSVRFPAGKSQSYCAFQSEGMYSLWDVLEYKCFFFLCVAAGQNVN